MRGGLVQLLQLRGRGAVLKGRLVPQRRADCAVDETLCEGGMWEGGGGM